MPTAIPIAALRHPLARTCLRELRSLLRPSRLLAAAALAVLFWLSSARTAHAGTQEAFFPHAASRAALELRP